MLNTTRGWIAVEGQGAAHHARIVGEGGDAAYPQDEGREQDDYEGERISRGGQDERPFDQRMG
jgi:hypothetical protein